MSEITGRDAMNEIQKEFGEYYKSFRESQEICNALHADLREHLHKLESKDGGAMTDVPELTADEAAVLRVRLFHPTLLAQAGDSITIRCLDDERADLGRAALAAYDAKERAKIISEEMAKIFQLPVPMTTATEVELRREYEERRLQHEKRCEQLAAEQRRKIRVEAMQRCLEAVIFNQENWDSVDNYGEVRGCADDADTIRALIAKEQA